jgi:acetyl-CoA carboxylase carboxyltransferase component
VLDDVIDPAETRDRISNVLRLTQRSPAREKKHAVDTW